MFPLAVAALSLPLAAAAVVPPEEVAVAPVGPVEAAAKPNPAEGIEQFDVFLTSAPGEVLQECGPVTFAWSGGVPPYKVDVQYGDTYRTLASTNGTSAEWTCDVPHGAQVAFYVWNEAGYGERSVRSGDADKLEPGPNYLRGLSVAEGRRYASGAALPACQLFGQQPNRGKHNVGAIVGGTIGAVAVVLVLAGASWYKWSRREQARQRTHEEFVHGLEALDLQEERKNTLSPYMSQAQKDRHCADPYASDAGAEGATSGSHQRETTTHSAKSGKSEQQYTRTYYVPPGESEPRSPSPHR